MQAENLLFGDVAQLKTGFRGLGWSSKRQTLDLMGPLGSSGLAELSSGEGRELLTYHLCLRSQVRGHL